MGQIRKLLRNVYIHTHRVNNFENCMFLSYLRWIQLSHAILFLRSASHQLLQLFNSVSNVIKKTLRQNYYEHIHMKISAWTSEETLDSTNDSIVLKSIAVCRKQTLLLACCQNSEDHCNKTKI